MPTLFVLVVVTVPRSTLSRPIWTPGTAAPVRSVTSPETVAVSVCPITALGNHMATNKDGPAIRSKRDSVIIEWTPLVSLMAAIPEKFAIENSNDFDLSASSAEGQSFRRKFVIDAERRARPIYGWFGWFPQ